MAARRWLPIAGFALVASANQMLWLSFTPITTGAAAHLHVSKSDIGLLSEIFPVLYVLLAVPIGRALDRWFRPTLLAGGLLTAGGGLLRIAGHTYGWILAGQVVIALAQPAVLSAITGIATRYLHEDHRPLGIAVGSGGTFLGFILAFVVGGAFGAGQLHALLLTSASYAAIAFVVLAVCLTSPVHGTASAVVPEASGIRELWRDRTLRTLTGLVFVGFGVFIALTTWAETLLKPHKVSSGHTDVLLTVMVVAGLLGSVIIPPLAAERRIQAPFILASAVAIVSGCALLAAAPALPTAAVALTIIGFLLLPDLPVILELAERRAGNAGGTATAFLWLAGNAGGILVAFAVQAVQGSATVAFTLLAVVAAGAVPLSLRLRRQLAAEMAAMPR